MKEGKILSMETLKENKALLRGCNQEFYPYICRVLNRLPEEVVAEKVLNDSSLSIISHTKNYFGRYFSFEIPLKHLIVLNETVLDTQEFEIIHTIAHEIAHKVVRKGDTGLLEKEAEELIIEWGFEEESKAVKYHRAILESEGYKIGYNWAKTTKDQITLSSIEEFYDEWGERCLSLERYEKLICVANPSSIVNEALLADHEQKLPTDIIMDDGYLDRCVVWGIMDFLKGKKRNAMKGAKHLKDEKLEFMKQLKSIQIEISKIFNKHRAFISNYERLKDNLRKAKIDIELLLYNKENVE